MEVSVVVSCDLEKKKKKIVFVFSSAFWAQEIKKKGEEFIASDRFGTESEKVLAVLLFFFLSMIHLHIEFP